MKITAAQVRTARKLAARRKRSGKFQDTRSIPRRTPWRFLTTHYSWTEEEITLKPGDPIIPCTELDSMGMGLSGNW